MKKTLLLTGIAALMATFSSCSLDEIKEVNQGTAIGFRTSVATRGIDANSTSNLRSFHCTALMDDGASYFEDLMFTQNGDYYISSPEYYWPKGENLWFYTYAPGVDEMGNKAKVTISKTEQKISDFQVAVNIDEQDDLIYACNTGTDNAGVEEDATVPLHFEHMLSRIEVRAYSNDKVHTYSFAGVRIGGVKMEGTVDLSNKTWSDVKTVSVCERTDKENTISMQYGSSSSSSSLLGQLEDKFNNSERNYAFMIPQTITAWDPANEAGNTQGGAYISVLVQINTVEEGARVYPTTGDYGWVAIPIPAVEWKAGYAYSYTLDFSNGAGYVDPTEPNAGETVLGDPISITMTMNEMQPGNDAVANPDMIGIWKAYDYTTNHYTFDSETNDFKFCHENRKINKDTHDDPLTAIGAQTSNFALVKIDDGTKLWTKVVGSQDWVYSSYYVGEGNLMYIETFRDQNDKTKYYLTPKISSIIPVTTDEQGIKPGKATIIVEEIYNNGQDKNETIILYEILPLTDETI